MTDPAAPWDEEQEMARRESPEYFSETRVAVGFVVRTLVPGSAIKKRKHCSAKLAALTVCTLIFKGQ